MSETAWTISKVLQWATEDFRTRGLVNPRLDAELLLAYALDIDRIRILIDSARPLAPADLSRYRELIRRRRAHEPIAYLLERREFYGRSFYVDTRVLIPRPDTETLIEVALRRSASRSLSARVLDLCTGSGCVAITLVRERPTWRVDSIDLSAEALEVARKNALQLGAIWNVRWLQGDLYAPLDPQRDRYDLLVANPPYIPDSELATLEPDVRDFEPRLALAGGPDGLFLMRRMLEGAPAFLYPGGVLATEVMAGQAPEVASLFERTGFSSIQIARDYGGHERVVSGIWKASLVPIRVS